MDIFALSGDKKRVLILGGGFGGIEIARRLDTRKYEVLLIDKHNYFTFQPLLYQVATGGLEPDSVAYPLRRSLVKTIKFFSGWLKFRKLMQQILRLLLQLENCHTINWCLQRAQQPIFSI